MSREGTSTELRLTRSLFEAANAADYDRIMSFFGADSVWDVSSWGLGSHTGLLAIRLSLEGWMGGFDEYGVVLEELADLGEGVVLAIATQHAHSDGGGRVELRYAPLFLWEGTLLACVIHYRDIDEARAEAAELAASRRRRSG